MIELLVLKKIITQLCIKKKGGGGGVGICIQGITFFFFTYTDEEPLLIDDQNGQREVLMEAVVEGERETEVAESEGLAEVMGLAEVEGIVEAELEDNHNCLLEDIINQLSSVASQLRFFHDSQTLFSFVSSGTIGLEHSHGLKIHNFSGSWSQYYPVLSFMMASSMLSIASSVVC